MRKKQLLRKALSGSRNIRFKEAISLAEAFGFRLSMVNGSHHIFVHPNVQELINLQNVKGMAKPYQIKQLLKMVEQYNLHLEDN